MDTQLTPKLNADLEGRVAERTAQLAAANEQLRTEIAERRRAEAQLRYQAQLLATVKDAVIATDEHLVITAWNPAAEALYGWQAGEVVGRPIVEVLQTEYDGTTREAVLQAALETGEYRGEVRQRRKDGSPVPIESTVRALRDANGRPMGLVGVNRDITERKRAEESLREAQAHTESVLASVADAHILFDRQWRYLYVNEAAVRSIGRPREQILGRTLWELYPDIVGTELDRQYHRAMDERIPIAFDFHYLTLDTWWENHFSPAPEGLAVFATNITEHKRAEERVRRDAARTGALLRVARVLNSQLDLENVIRTICEETRRVMNVPIAMVALFDETQDVFQFAGGSGVPADWATRVQPVPRNFFEEHLKTTGPLIVIPDSQAVPGLPNAEFFQALNVRTHVIITMLLDGRPIGNLRVATVDQVRTFDEDEMQLLQGLADQAALAIRNARLFQSLNEQREQLHALSARLVDMQESERRRLAWEIHDDVSQSLTALMMQLGAVQGLLPKSSDRARAILKGAETLTGKTLEGVRRMIADLRPPVLDDLGLAPALRRLGDELHERAGVDVAFEVSGLRGRLPPQMENALFRMAQEALTNIRKHAQAQHAALSLKVERERVTLLVKDDGVGLLRQREQARRRGDVLIPGGWVVLRGHYGLVGIQERAALLGGTLQVQSAPGEGTTLRVELPR
jgi:PAS domain S-box-containing protein